MRRIGRGTKHVLAVALGATLAAGVPEGVAILFELRPAPRYLEVQDVGGRPELHPLAEVRGFRGRVALDPLPVAAAPEEFRIAAFGASTTAGVPFENHTIWRWLAADLHARLPGIRPVILNFGLGGAAITHVAEIEREIPPGTFHLAVVYAGNNEFLRPYPAVARRRLNRGAVEALAALARATRFGAWLSDRLAGTAATPDAPETFPAEEVHDDDWPRLKELVLDLAERRYRDLLENLLDRRVPVLAVLPAADPTLHSPILSRFRSDRTPAERQRVLELRHAADIALGEDQPEPALSLADGMVALAPEFAAGHALRARALAALGRAAEARAAYAASDRLDLMPAWATEPRRARLRGVAERLGVPWFDAQELFDGASHLGDDGRLLVDHCHPTIRGQIVIAAAMAEALRAHGLVRPGAEWGPPRVILAEELERARRDEAGLPARTAHNFLAMYLNAPQRPQTLTRIERAYEDALALDAADTDLLLGLGIVRGLLGRVEEARVLWERASATAPDRVELRIGEMATRSTAIRDLTERIRTDRPR